MTNITHIAFAASFLLLPLTMIFVGGLLFRADLARAGSAKEPSRLRRDLRSLEVVLVEFFARSKTSSTVLSTLAAHGIPVGYKTLVERVCAGQGPDDDGEDFPAAAVQTVLVIMQVAALICMNRQGFSITDSGREVHRRITQPAAV